jgi:3-hydroxyacyl-[acyl-carrier-protein] dehydratase
VKFRLVDQILFWSPYQSIRGIKTVSFEEYGLKEAFGDEPHLPESLLVESVLQLGNWLILRSSDFNQMAMIVRIAKINFHGFLLPGQRLEMEVTLSRLHDGFFRMAGEGRVNGRTIVTGMDCLAVPAPAREFVDPEDARVVFSEIYRPEEKSR